MQKLFEISKSLYLFTLNNNQFSLRSILFKIILITVTEICSITMIILYMNIAISSDLILNNFLLKNIFNSLNISLNEFIIFLGLTTLIIIVVLNILSIKSLGVLNLFIAQLSASVTTGVYRKYLFENWLFFKNNSNYKIINLVVNDCRRFGDKIIYPLITIFSKVVFLLFVITAIILIDAKIAFISLIVFTTLFLAFFHLSKKLLIKNDVNINVHEHYRVNLITNSLGAIKDLIFNNIRGEYLNKVELTNSQLANSQASNRTIALIPRLIIELILFISLIMFVLFLFAFKAKGLENIIPQLLIFLIIGLKIIPAIQNIYSNYTQIIGNITSFEKIKKYIKNDKLEYSKDKISIDRISSLELKDIIFSYPSNKRIFDKLNLSISENETIGIMGESGQGKSTLVDLITKLLDRNNGKILINGTSIDQLDLDSFREKITLIHQRPFLIDGTIKENILLGNQNLIDEKKLSESIKLANLNSLIISLPKKIDTEIINNGINFSVGEKQRICIARMFYNSSDLLIFDEATNSLDKKNEKLILKNISSLKNKIKIIISHNLNTINFCDKIYILENGELNLLK